MTKRKETERLQIELDECRHKLENYCEASGPRRASSNMPQANLITYPSEGALVVLALERFENSLGLRWVCHGGPGIGGKLRSDMDAPKCIVCNTRHWSTQPCPAMADVISEERKQRIQLQRVRAG